MLKLGNLVVKVYSETVLILGLEGGVKDREPNDEWIGLLSTV